VSILKSVVVVLHKPQDPINIGATVRAMKNMGVSQLRLIDPCPYDPWRIEGVAHGTRDVVARIRHFASLDDAVADCVAVAAFAGKRRAVKWPVTTPRDMAPRLLDAAVHGPVAVVFGQEDHGLSGESLDRAGLLVMIPTTEHSSLNLAQAVLVALYELHLAAGDATRVVAPPKKDAPPASHEEWERFYADAARALAALDFFKTRNEEHVMRSVRSLAARAEPDARELKLLRAMCFEVLRTIDRVRREARGSSRGGPVHSEGDTGSR
jgi:tRNA/rRNA methyltransferase/tRNA (cytidine32/uridine32-2'-O)-methyltransferase